VRTSLILVLLAVVAAGAAVAAIVSSGGGTGGRTSTSAHHLVLAAPRQPAVTRGAKWVTGPVDKILTDVNADLGTVDADQRAGKYAAVRISGAQLAADAGAALAGQMPPVDAAIYRSALKDYEQIGVDAASGNFSKASPLVAAATLNLMKVTAAVDQSAPANSSAQVNDP
jgi:hypothetical protein